MTDFDLEKLKELPVPAPREDAKRAARAAALEAYDAAAGKDNATSSKENSTPPRLTSTPHPAVRRKFMPITRTQYALAASVAALVVAAPTAFRQFESGPGLTKTGGKLTGDMERSDAQSPAPKSSQIEAAVPQSGETPVVIARQNEPKEKAVAGLDKPEPAPAARSRAGDGISAPAGQAAPPVAIGGEPAVKDQRSAEPKADLNKKHEGDSAGKVEFGDKAYLKGSENKVLQEIPLAVVPAKPTDGLAAKMAVQPRTLLPSADGRLRGEQLTAGYDPSAHRDETERRTVLVEQEYRDRFEAKETNPVKQVASEPVSTFSIDVDTASYSVVRRALTQGRLPPKDAVRVEEMINYFPYDYPRPETAGTPFQPTVSVMPSPWNANNQLVHIGIKGYDLTSAERPRANLVFLMDVSGSMQPADRLPLVKNAFRMLVDELKPNDTVAIVTYASGSGVLLEPTKISDKAKIQSAIDQLGAGGSTGGAEGIQDAYRLAEANFDKVAVNRVILATDGDFNVGITNQDELKGLIERKREKGVFLSILGVGEGNYNDSLMQTLAQNGNGTAAYVDTLSEARKVLVDEASSTLFTIAKDVKIQVEWNPARVSEYRLVGYETRALKREDFNNDKIDAGDIGSGHTVTAIYEITPSGSQQKLVDDLRYGKAAKTASAERAEPVSPVVTNEIGFLKLRYKLPKEEASKLTTIAIGNDMVKDGIANVPAEARFSIAVAAFGQVLKGASYTKSFTYDDVIALAQSAKGDDPFGYRAEFVSLVRLAKSAQP